MPLPEMLRALEGARTADDFAALREQAEEELTVREFTDFSEAWLMMRFAAGVPR